MKETLDEQSCLSLIKYRIDRADQTILESKLLAKEGYYNAAINRLYYACFYAVLALFVANGITTVTHAGVKTMLGLNFISKGLIPNEHGKTFSRLFEIRHSGDYDDFVYCDKEMIDEYTPKAEAFIHIIRRLLEESGKL
ncbi:MAG: HEPN domain-containing protein [Bacteroidales bacterium]|nr:HEPN domain-containing protein [Bacteroidales bacterium]MBP5214842.1 HEPN domain-containing protein [Bacteroidales bacterium]